MLGIFTHWQYGLQCQLPFQTLSSISNWIQPGNTLHWNDYIYYLYILLAKLVTHHMFIFLSIFIRDNLIKLGDEHMNASIDQVIGSHYMSSHWLATFITYALQLREKVVEQWYCSIISYLSHCNCMTNKASSIYT